MSWISLVAFLLFAAPFAEAQTSQPSPDLDPEDVVRIQVEALQNNDVPAPDAGIGVAFRFASPGNRVATGPLPRFTQMIRMGYPDLLGFERAEYAPIQVLDGRAVQAVTLVQASGERTRYVFGLSQQRGGSCDGCWMTDAVVPQEEDGTTRI